MSAGTLKLLKGLIPALFAVAVLVSAGAASAQLFDDYDYYGYYGDYYDETWGEEEWGDWW